MDIVAGGEVIGKIRQIWDWKNPIYNICDAAGLGGARKRYYSGVRLRGYSRDL